MRSRSKDDLGSLVRTPSQRVAEARLIAKTTGMSASQKTAMINFARRMNAENKMLFDLLKKLEADLYLPSMRHRNRKYQIADRQEKKAAKKR